MGFKDRVRYTPEEVQALLYPKKLTRKYEVKASWLKACGRGDVAKVFDIVKENPPGGPHGNLSYVVLADPTDTHPDRVWGVIAEWRGRFVEVDEAGNVFAIATY